MGSLLIEGNKKAKANQNIKLVETMRFLWVLGSGIFV